MAELVVMAKLGIDYLNRETGEVSVASVSSQCSENQVKMKLVALDVYSGLTRVYTCVRMFVLSPT